MRLELLRLGGKVNTADEHGAQVLGCTRTPRDHTQPWSAWLRCKRTLAGKKKKTGPARPACQRASERARRSERTLLGSLVRRRQLVRLVLHLLQPLLHRLQLLAHGNRRALRDEERHRAEWVLRLRSPRRRPPHPRRRRPRPHRLRRTPRRRLPPRPWLSVVEQAEQRSARASSSVPWIYRSIYLDLFGSQIQGDLFGAAQWRI